MSSAYQLSSPYNQDAVISRVKQQYSSNDSYPVSSSFAQSPRQTSYSNHNNVVRLEFEVLNLREEIDQLKTANMLLKQEELARAQRDSAQDFENQRVYKQQRDDLMRDVQDLARCNRLLSAENEQMNEKYINLYAAHNRLINGDDRERGTAASRLADVYLKNIRSETQLRTKATSESDQFERQIQKLQQQSESNTQQIRDSYTAFKGRLLRIQESEDPLNRNISASSSNNQFFQDVFERVFRLNQQQDKLNAEIIGKLNAQNRELQSKLDQGIVVVNKNGIMNPSAQGQSQLSIQKRSSSIEQTPMFSNGDDKQLEQAKFFSQQSQESQPQDKDKKPEQPVQETKANAAKELTKTKKATVKKQPSKKVLESKPQSSLNHLDVSILSKKSAVSKRSATAKGTDLKKTASKVSIRNDGLKSSASIAVSKRNIKSPNTLAPPQIIVKKPSDS